MSASVVAVVAVVACDDALAPSAEVDGLRFTATADVGPLAGASDPVVSASVSVRNVAGRRIERTYDGGCFIRRFQAFLEQGGVRRLAWDSDRSPNWACTDDLALIDLAPGETARPHNWGAGVPVAQMRDSLPAGRYEIVIRIQADDRELSAGFVRLD
ncbi:MAG: hypothetical protein R3195_02555 [Gemmatimonadota bacterium]|nr:hypothetical protein [Gemmatimonadota bacterium]